MRQGSSWLVWFNAPEFRMLGIDDREVDGLAVPLPGSPHSHPNP